MTGYRAQEKEIVYALDIGTRSVVGMVGQLKGDRFQVLDIETAEHDSRTMIDGQIDDIRQVGALARSVTERLSQRLGIRLNRVSVAAAGRALRTQKGSFSIELPGEARVNAEAISRLEAGAVTAAEEALQLDEEGRRQFFLVGYTVAQYRLDGYPLSVLLDHSGRVAEADVVATFLPGEVVESLYAAMRAAELQVASMTLEPIAAMNAAIPAELRLLNLALVDIGAGTTDIAICREGSVVGYTMATIAGDEITEAIMQAFLVDFRTAEEIKRTLTPGKDVTYTDILGLETTCSYEEVLAAIEEPTERLAEAIATQIVAVNGSSPSAVFLAGGGSKLDGLRVRVADRLQMSEKRVAIAGNNYAKSAFSETVKLENPEYATPLGIAVSAGMGLLNDSYVVTLNGQVAKLFRNGSLTVRDVLLMNGYTYADIVGRGGDKLSITVDGKRRIYHGEPAIPAALLLNGQEASITTVVHAGDSLQFIPAVPGTDAKKTLREVLDKDFSGKVLLNNVEAPPDTLLQSGDVVLLPEPPVRSQKQEEKPEPKPAPKAEPIPVKPPQPARGKNITVYLNDKPVGLPGKADGQPHYLMDLLEFSGLDFDNLSRPVELSVNGVPSSFLEELKDRDTVIIRVVE